MPQIAFEPKEFLIELCKYYMEFLETDFHVNRPPSRKISFRNNDGFMTDIRLSKYPRLNEQAINSLLSNFQKNPFANICKKDSPNTRKAKYEDNGFFQQSSSDDATNLFYDEIYDLWKNKQVLDKQDFYLYLFDLKFKDVVYPLFYMPLTIERTDEGGFAVEFDPVLLINKKAIQYVNEQLRNENDKVPIIDLPPRHVYLSKFEEKGDLLSFLQKIVNEICQCFGLRQFGKIDEIIATEINNGNLDISNKCYFSIFDKSDEAILNDYEELLNIINSGKEGEALEIFSKLSADYLFGENPKIFTKEVDDEYNNQGVSTKLAYSSPIPLNTEQLKVLSAITKKDCDRIIIEGPPGTGKSHTITAIIYHALLNKKSVLMVSDKKEALDVVEEKINGVLDKMKLEDFIQNPIVRLGKKENTFAGIFKQENFGKIKDRFINYQRNKKRVEQEIENTLSAIKRHIDDEVEGGLVLDPARIQKILQYEKTYETLWDKLLDLDELQDTGNSLELLKTLWRALRDLYGACHSLNSQFKINIIKTQLPLAALNTITVSLDKDLIALHKKICSEYPSILLSKEITRQNVDFLEECLTEIEKLKKPVIGYLFSGKKVEALQKKFEEQFFVSATISLKHKRKHLQKELQLYKYCQRINENWNNISLDLFVVLKENCFNKVSTTLQQMSQSIQTILSVIDELPAACQMMGLNVEDVNTVLSNSFLKFKEDDISELTEYLTNYFSVLDASAKIVRSDYTSMRAALENCFVFKMTNILDGSVIDFRENNYADAQELIKIIKAKRKIPRDYLQKLVTAFPCLIVSVRELGEFIPLEPNLFDIVIIDEASQVSIAQAFPAILRGKKVVVLGDEKQYSNVKSHNAGKQINNQLLNHVKDAFKRGISNLDVDIKEKVKDKVESFNIKNSILDFIRSIPNYRCMLKKHFRGYMEIIGYSNDTFYKGSLQVMKIRGKSINDVIQFYPVETENKIEKYKNTNQAEVDFILAELQRLKNENFQGSIGIITPFTNQQKLISSRVYDSEHWTFYQNQFKLKVMTFDSCQGDEKDIIYYSMVEKLDEDILRHIFPIDPNGVGDDDGKLKSQRLNVGFSRAKESIRFVLSKNPKDIRGAVGEALRWYEKALKKPDDFELIKKTDPKSHGKEAELYNLVKQTPFYKENESRIEIIPQFEIGKYIKQLDIFAKIPDYRNDFLFIYNGEEQTRMIILEYDGYENHFEDSEFINKFNYDRFYVEGDVERRKTIESYGFPFIRMNKFLLRDDPITFLNEQLEVHCKKKI